MAVWLAECGESCAEVDPKELNWFKVRKAQKSEEEKSGLLTGDRIIKDLARRPRGRRLPRPGRKHMVPKGLPKLARSRRPMAHHHPLKPQAGTLHDSPRDHLYPRRV